MSANHGATQRGLSGDLDPATTPWIDESGVLRVGRRWMPLSASEWEVLAPLVARFGRTVSRDELVRSVSHDTPIRPSALNVRITRIRSRVEPLGLRLINVRKRGYILDRARDVAPGRQVYESNT